MIQTKELEIPLKWGSLRAQMFGEASPNKRPIVALHGFLDNSNSFKPIAPYIVANDKYYLISVDLPGHGFSSHIPTGIYSPKTMLICLRRLVQYLKLKNIILMSHSYGCNVNLLNVELLMQTWNYGIDHLLEISYEDDSEEKPDRVDLTKDLALEILLKANKSLDQEAGKTLLERALVTRNDKLEFSRDPMVRDQIRWRPENMLVNDHYAEYYGMFEALSNCSTNPTLFLISTPQTFFGEDVNNQTIESLKHSKNKLEVDYINGSHHFHMIKPEETAKRILDFLDQNLNGDNDFEIKAKL